MQNTLKFDGCRIIIIFIAFVIFIDWFPWKIQDHLLQTLLIFVDLQRIFLYWPRKSITNNNNYNPAAIKFQCILHGYLLQCNFRFSINHSFINTRGRTLWVLVSLKRTRLYWVTIVFEIILKHVVFSFNESKKYIKIKFLYLLLL